MVLSYQNKSIFANLLGTAKFTGIYKTAAASNLKKKKKKNMLTGPVKFRLEI